MKLKYDLRIYEFDSGVYIGYFVDQEEATEHLVQILKDQEDAEKYRKLPEIVTLQLKDAEILQKARDWITEHKFVVNTEGLLKILGEEK